MDLYKATIRSIRTRCFLSPSKIDTMAELWYITDITIGWSKKRSIIQLKELEKSLRDLKRHPPPLDLHALYRLHLQSLLVVICTQYEIISAEISYEYNHHSTSQLNYNIYQLAYYFSTTISLAVKAVHESVQFAQTAHFFLSYVPHTHTHTHTHQSLYPSWRAAHARGNNIMQKNQLILFIYELASLYSAVSIWKDSLGTLLPV